MQMFDGLLNVYTITGCDRVLNKLQGDKMSYFSFICFMCLKNILARTQRAKNLLCNYYFRFVFPKICLEENFIKLWYFKNTNLDFPYNLFHSVCLYLRSSIMLKLKRYLV